MISTGPVGGAPLPLISVTPLMTNLSKGPSPSLRFGAFSIWAKSEHPKNKRKKDTVVLNKCCFIMIKVGFDQKVLISSTDHNEAYLIGIDYFSSFSRFRSRDIPPWLHFPSNLPSFISPSYVPAIADIESFKTSSVKEIVSKAMS